MAIEKSKQILLAQNFLRSPLLVRSLIQASSIGPADTVVEIGAGRGIITAELARIARRVIAVEKDISLMQQLRRQFRTAGNVEIIEGNFLQVNICVREFKIFANIPYNITADVLRRILFLYPTPTAAYLIVQKEAAEKYSGVPNETQCSVLSKPRFRFQILHQLHRNDFEPVPRVDSVLLGIEKRSPPLIGDDEIDLYNNFIRYGFGRWRRSLKCIFKPIFTYPQWKRLSAELRFPLNATPTNLTFEQWLGLFDCFQHRVVEYKQRLIQVS